MHVSTKDRGYDGLYLTLMKNGEVVYDQANVKYEWSVADPSILTLNTWTDQALCSGSPCTTHSVKLRGLKKGSTSMYVVAYVDGLKSAATTINVEVEDTWKLRMLEAVNPLHVGKTAGYVVGLGKTDDPRYIPDSDITYIWQTVSSPNTEASINLTPLSCDTPVCSYSQYQITGIRPGKTSLEIIAVSRDVKLAFLKYEIEVTENEELVFDRELYDNNNVTEISDYRRYINEKWEDIPEDVKAEYPYLKSELEEHRRLLQEQQRQLREQEVRLKSTESLLQKILTILRGFFN